MTSYPAFCDHILHQNELVAAGICHGDTWNLIFINNMLGEILKLSPGRMDDEPFLPRLTRCGFDEVEESLSEPHGGELIAHHKEGSMYIIRWKSVSIDDSAGGEQVRLITMSKIPVDQINRVAELPWQELTVLLDSIHDGIWVIDSDGITLRVNKAMERIAGLRAEEVIGKHVTEPMHKGRFETCVTLRALIEKRSVTMFDDYSNGKRCLNTSTPIFDEKGNVWRVIASIRDMTELETLQRKLTDLEMETLAYKARLENLETEMDAGFVGHSAPMRRLRKQASKAARTEAITLILGETGTGKTLTAKAIHDMGQRSAEPFIAVNCGAIPMSLMESELFGYEKGAFTGETSPVMLNELEVEYVILGHSERRQYFAETDETVNKKVLSALAHNLKPIICVGETLEQREAGVTDKLVSDQTIAALQGVKDFSTIVIAYEPVWAIGTGKTATADEANRVCGVIRAAIAKEFGAEVGENIRIQYGGSMNAGNVADLMAQPEIDGGLIGGAALKPVDFSKLVNNQ